MWREHRVTTEHDFHKPKDLSRFPEHAQKYPSLERTHLCDVQRSTYNPAIPTLRQMDMDNALHKLPDQHCRTTTLCSAECFDKASNIHHDTSHKEVRRDYCIDKLLEKYSFDINKLRNPDFDILKICPPERKFMEAALSKEDYGQYCIRFDPCLKESSKAMNMACDGEFDRMSSTQNRNTSRIWNAAAMPCWYLHKY